MSEANNAVAGMAGAVSGPYGLLLSVGFDLAKALVSHLTKSKAPQEIIDAAQTTVNAIEAHAKDTMTSDQWDALRVPIPTEGKSQ